jgi:hypothetical protein
MNRCIQTERAITDDCPGRRKDSGDLNNAADLDVKALAFETNPVNFRLIRPKVFSDKDRQRPNLPECAVILN